MAMLRNQHSKHPTWLPSACRTSRPSTSWTRTTRSKTRPSSTWCTPLIAHTPDPADLRAPVDGCQWASGGLEHVAVKLGIHVCCALQYKTQLESLRSKVVEDMDTVKRRDNLDFVQVGLTPGCRRVAFTVGWRCLSVTSDHGLCSLHSQLVGLAVPSGSLFAGHLMHLSACAGGPCRAEGEAGAVSVGDDCWRDACDRPARFVGACSACRVHLLFNSINRHVNDCWDQSTGHHYANNHPLSHTTVSTGHTSQSTQSPMQFHSRAAYSYSLNTLRLELSVCQKMVTLCSHQLTHTYTLSRQSI